MSGTDNAMHPAMAVIRALPRAALMVVLLVVVPSFFGLATIGSRGAVPLVIGSLVSFVIVRSLGWRLTRTHVPVLAVAYAAGAATAGTWAAVAVAALAGALGGYSTRWGTVPLYGFAAVVVTTAQPFDRGAQGSFGVVGDVLLSLAMVCIGGLFGTELARRTGAAESTRMPLGPVDRAARLAVILAAALGVATAVAVWWGGQHGYWIPMTVALVALPSAQSGLARGSERLIGTVVGLLALLPLVVVTPPRPVTVVLAALLLVLVIVVQQPYWLHTALVTMMILLLVAPDSTLVVAGERLAETIAGLVILAAAGAVLVWWDARHDSAPASVDTGER